MVAEGQADESPRFTDSKKWDTDARPAISK